MVLPCNDRAGVALGCLRQDGAQLGRLVAHGATVSRNGATHITECFLLRLCPFSFHVTWGFFSSFPAMLSQCHQPSVSAGCACGPSARTLLL